MDLLILLDQMDAAVHRATTLETLDNLTGSLMDLSLNTEVTTQHDAFWEGYMKVCESLDQRYDKLYGHKVLS